MTVADPAALPTTGTWQIDTVHSYASFKVTHHLVATFRAGFHSLRGALEDGVLFGSVPVENIDLGGVAVFKEHLLGPDWFDAAAHPELSFTSSDLQIGDDGSIRAAGELTIKGITRPVRITGSARGPAEVKRNDGSTSIRGGLDLAATVDRRDFGLNSTSGTDWTVTLEVALELVKS